MGISPSDYATNKKYLLKDRFLTMHKKIIYKKRFFDEKY